MEKILHYFPTLSKSQIEQFARLEVLYKDWNSKINVISRKDIDSLYEKHVLHALAIAKVQAFLPESAILDIGTGGGFPGIPLAILFPEVQFTLIDIVGKKIKVVEAISNELGLKHVTAKQQRAETLSQHFDFIVSRAVTNMTEFVVWTTGKFRSKSRHELQNGILYLKGGDLTTELSTFPKARQFEISDFFTEEFFETKKVVYLPR